MESGRTRGRNQLLVARRFHQVCDHCSLFVNRGHCSSHDYHLMLQQRTLQNLLHRFSSWMLYVLKLCLISITHRLRCQCALPIRSCCMTIVGGQKELLYDITMNHINEMTFKISSFNCRGLKGSTTNINLLAQFFDIICLQETWLMPNKLHCLNKLIPNMSGFGISAVDPSVDLLHGRPYGGIVCL